MASKRDARPTILAVDHEPALLEAMERALKDAGYRVVCIDDGAKVRKRLRKTRPDLLLISSYLDTVDVADLCRDLGEDMKLAVIPIVIMNDRNSPLDPETIRDIGAADFIRKPFAPEALLALIDHVLNRSAAPRPEVLRPEGGGRFADQQPQDPAVRIAQAFGRAVSAGGDVGASVREMLRDAGIQEDLHGLLQTAQAAKGPALTGDLGLVPIAEVLQLLSLQRQTGEFIVSRGDGRITILLDQGTARQAIGVNVPEELMLGNLIVREGLVGAQEMRMLLGSRRAGGHRLGAQLIGLGHVTPDDLQKTLKTQSAELFYQLLRWPDGRFRFERRAELPPQVRELGFVLRTDELLMEGFRRVDEWGQIESALPSFDAVLRRLPKDEQRVSTDGLEPKEREVLAAVDGKRTVRDIIASVGWGTFEVASVLYRLVSARAVAAD